MKGELVRSLAEPLTVVEVHLHALIRLAEALEAIRGDIEWSRRDAETAKVREGLAALAAQASKLRKELRQDIASLQAALEETLRSSSDVPIDVTSGPPGEEPQRYDPSRPQDDTHPPKHATADDLRVWKALNKAHEKLSNLEARLDGWERKERDAQRLLVALQDAQTASQATLLEKLRSLAVNFEALGKELREFIAEERRETDQRLRKIRDALEKTATRVKRHWRIGLWLLFLLFLVAVAALFRPILAWW